MRNGCWNCAHFVKRGGKYCHCEALDVPKRGDESPCLLYVHYVLEGGVEV